MSDLRRFFVEKVLNETIISGDEFFHAVNVLRVREGDEIIVCDNSNFEYVFKITKINKKDLVATKIEKRLNQCEPKTELTLIAGYLKGDKTELVVQKAVELGVKNIVVFSSKFSSAFMNENKLLRLNKVAIESAKQCGRSIAPMVSYAENLESALEFGLKCENKLFACEFALKNEVDFSSINGSTAVVVGSEGGFSREEYALALKKGYKTVYLGKRILRAETACIALTAILMNALKEF